MLPQVQQQLKLFHLKGKLYRYIYVCVCVCLSLSLADSYAVNVVASH
jgi:hypothetical protein